MEDPKYMQTETEKPQMQTTREPDNTAPKGSPGRLHLLAETVLASWEQKPDAWYGEFVEWRESILGERPRKEGGKRGYENFNLVSLGMILAWGYFAAQLSESTEDEALDRVPTVAPVQEAAQLSLPYTILGPDGNAVVEGYK